MRDVAGGKAEVAYTKYKARMAVGWQWVAVVVAEVAACMCMESVQGRGDNRPMGKHQAQGMHGMWCPCMNASVVREGVGADGEKVLCLGLTQLAGGC